MFRYLLKTRKGQFVLSGIIFIIIGFILVNTTFSQLAFYVAIIFLGIFAAKEAVIKSIHSKSPNVDLLMILAALGAVTIGYESEGALLLLIFAGAELLEDYMSNKSSNSIKELMSYIPSVAQVIHENGEIIEVATENLKVGDIVIVSKGSQVPIDGVIDRETQINEATLTGESVPVMKMKGDEVFAGTHNEGHAFHMTVSRSKDQTVFSNIVCMVEEAQNRSSTISKFIDRFEKYYVISVLLALPLFVAALYYINAITFEEAFYRGMVFLTVASPCALVVSVTPATLSAISNCARNGILVKGGAALEVLASMEVLYSDKTGTITYGDFEVIEYEATEAIIKEVVFMELQSTHPIAKAIVAKFAHLDLSSVDYIEPVEEISGYGLKKGNIKVGKPSAFEGFADDHNYRSKATQQYTTIFVAEDEHIVGYFSLRDQVRTEAIEAVSGFQKAGIKVIMLTGDNETTAKRVAGEVLVDDYVAGCLPEDKINYIMNSQKNKKIVGMIGDGINDAPALANADIGIAMGSGASVAMESANIVIVKNDLTKLLYSYRLSHRLNKMIKQNITFAVGVIVLLTTLNLLGLLDLPVGVVLHEGSTILVIINGLRLLRSHDKKKSNLIE